jgi:hypothetical protein
MRKRRRGWRIAMLIVYTATLSAGNHCWKIKEADMRHYCEAKAEHKKSCWKIKNSDEKYFCEAVAEHKKSCWRIADQDKQNLCKALAGE